MGSAARHWALKKMVADSNPAPAYPPASKRMQEEGRVLLDVYILPDGSVGEIKLEVSICPLRIERTLGSYA